MEEHNMFIFHFVMPFSWDASILKYSSTSSTRVSFFFYLVALGVFFCAGALQG